MPAGTGKKYLCIHHFQKFFIFFSNQIELENALKSATNIRGIQLHEIYKHSFSLKKILLNNNHLWNISYQELP